MNRRVSRILIDHFFRRFFDNDTLQIEGETLTTIVRAIAVVAVPGLMFAFFLQPQYSRIPQRPLWAAIQDQYFFVLFSFVVMGAVCIFEGEMLFPDRLDFLILTPLSVKPVRMLAAKAAALVAFLGLFLLSCNGFGAILLPAVSKGDFYRQVYAHTAAVALAGVFACLSFLALSGVLLCVLGAAWFRKVSPLLQLLSVMALVLLMIHYVEFGDALRTLLTTPLGMARWMPPLWFLGVYEHLLRGAAAPAFAATFTTYALRATGLALLLVLLTYPLAWARMRRLAVEGESRKRRQSWRLSAGLVPRVIERPGERAVFTFIGHALRRNSRYHVYLAMYGGTGLALAMACAVTFHAGRPVLSQPGLHAILPLLLFWVIAGLRTAFAFPVNLSAGWIFRLTGVSKIECAAAGRRWVLCCALAVTFATLLALCVVGWSARLLLVQLVCGLCLCFLLTDGFFLLLQSVPFNTPRMPGKTSLPLLLTLYVGVFPPFVFGVIALEQKLEKNLFKLVLLGCVAALAHVAANRLRDRPEEIEEEMEGYEGEFQLLGLG